MALITPKLPLPLRLLNTAGSALDAAGPGRARLEEDALLEAASRRTGLTDFGDPGFLEGLRVLLASAEHDGHLHFVGRLSVRQVVLTGLVNRLLLTQAQKRTPERFAQPLAPPLIVTGLPRTGTTLLHRLLAEDPAHHAPRFWELLSPLPRPGRNDTRRRRIKLFMGARRLLPGDLDRKHFFTADSPEEDFFMLGATFEAWSFWGLAPVYGYLDWYLEQDHARKYREYRAWLQVLQAAHPGRRLVLKAPEHAGALAALLRAVPEARLVQLHRDPVTAFASFASLSRTTQGPATDALDVLRNAAANLRLLSKTAERNLADRDAHPGAVLDVWYDDLVADPGGTVGRVYARYDLVSPDRHRERLGRYLRENPQGKHGAHRYATSDLGLSDAAVRERFAAYSERFGFAR